MHIMQISNINSGYKNISNKAALRVTPTARNIVYKTESNNTVLSNLVFNRSMRKFQSMICGEFPFAGDVFFDAISKKTKAAKPHTNAKYEMRLLDKNVDFDFNISGLTQDYSNKPLDEKIENEANKQAKYLYDTYCYLRGMCNK